MILTGLEIENQIINGNILIDPYDKSKLNTNSYNLTLDDKIVEYTNYELDMKKEEPIRTVTIDKNNGLLLLPNRLYLAKTVEYTETREYIPMIEGRSSIGRLGVFIHITAGFGDIGFSGPWVLEISCIQPVRIYPFIEIAQIYYHTYLGEINNDTIYKGKYQNKTSITPSLLWKELTK